MYTNALPTGFRPFPDSSGPENKNKVRALSYAAFALKNSKNVENSPSSMPPEASASNACMTPARYSGVHSYLRRRARAHRRHTLCFAFVHARLCMHF